LGRDWLAGDNVLQPLSVANVKNKLSVIGGDQRVPPKTAAADYKTSGPGQLSPDWGGAVDSRRAVKGAVIALTT